MRTLEDIQKDYEVAKKELEPIEKEREKAVKKLNQLYDEMENFKLQNGLFHKMSELEQHKGKHIHRIKLVVRCRDGNLSTKDMYNDEYFKVDEKGHLDYSSYAFGIMRYSELNHKYSYMFHHTETLYDFAGYLDVDFENDDESEGGNDEF